MNHNTIAIIADRYFDGQSLQDAGPYTLLIEKGRISHIESADLSQIGLGLAKDVHVIHAPFVMPGLCEAHCHLFLNGNELDFEKRKQYLKAPRQQMYQLAHRSLADNFNSGITLIRDAGDIHGINILVRQALAQEKSTLPKPQLRCPGRAMRKTKRYGSFMAVETTGELEDITKTVDTLAQEADDLKILLTGIIDFENGQMKGDVQFNLEQTRHIVKEAQTHNLLTYAHCSGPDGLVIATEAGINSIEHGFFMEKRFLEVMAQKQIAWVPTFSPVYFQYQRPELAGWNKTTVDKLWGILENHFKHLAMADQMGVPIVAGSDAGSYGAAHGMGLIDEMLFHRQAGLSVDAVLASATTTPRRLWGCDSACIDKGSVADLITLVGSPYDDMENLKTVHKIILGDAVYTVSENKSAITSRV